MPALKLPIFARTLSVATSTAEESRSQWRNPSDILSLLLLVGGEVIQQSIAQLSGHPSLPTPVVFSFGWVAYTFKALLSAAGDNRLMPPAPDLQSVVISVPHGHVRTNQSWVIGRLLRDYEHCWMPEPVRKELEAMLKRAQSPKAGLCVAIFEADPTREAGRPVWDWLIVTGYIVAVLQIIIAAIPWIVWGEWEIFAITICGTVLAFSTASLPQWRSERYACRRNSTGTVVLTRGNGAQHAIVIQGHGCGLNLEDLAGATEGGSKSHITRTAIAVLSCLWVGLLITVSGIKEKTWFAVAVGAIGMLFSIVVAGAPRKPEAFGVPLVYKAVCIENRTMETLKKVEGLYPGVGRSMTATFFPGGLHDADAKWWAKSKKAAKAAEREKRSEMRWRQNGDAVPKQRNLSVDGLKCGSGPNGSTNDQNLLQNATQKTELANNEYQ